MLAGHRKTIRPGPGENDFKATVTSQVDQNPAVVWIVLHHQKHGIAREDVLTIVRNFLLADNNRRNDRLVRDRSRRVLAGGNCPGARVSVYCMELSRRA